MNVKIYEFAYLLKILVGLLCTSKLKFKRNFQSNFEIYQKHSDVQINKKTLQTLKVPSKTPVKVENDSKSLKQQLSSTGKVTQRFGNIKLEDTTNNSENSQNDISRGFEKSTNTSLSAIDITQRKKEKISKAANSTKAVREKKPSNQLQNHSLLPSNPSISAIIEKYLPRNDNPISFYESENEANTIIPFAYSEKKLFHSDISSIANDTSDFSDYCSIKNQVNFLNSEIVGTKRKAPASKNTINKRNKSNNGGHKIHEIHINIKDNMKNDELKKKPSLKKRNIKFANNYKREKNKQKPIKFKEELTKVEEGKTVQGTLDQFTQGKIVKDKLDRIIQDKMVKVKLDRFSQGKMVQITLDGFTQNEQNIRCNNNLALTIQSLFNENDLLNRLETNIEYLYTQHKLIRTSTPIESLIVVEITNEIILSLYHECVELKNYLSSYWSNINQFSLSLYNKFSLENLKFLYPGLVSLNKIQSLVSTNKNWNCMKSDSEQILKESKIGKIFLKEMNKICELLLKILYCEGNSLCILFSYWDDFRNQNGIEMMMELSLELTYKLLLILDSLVKQSDIILHKLKSIFMSYIEFNILLSLLVDMDKKNNNPIIMVKNIKTQDLTHKIVKKLIEMIQLFSNEKRPAVIFKDIFDRSYKQFDILIDTTIPELINLENQSKPKPEDKPKNLKYFIQDNDLASLNSGFTLANYCNASAGEDQKPKNSPKLNAEMKFYAIFFKYLMLSWCNIAKDALMLEAILNNPVELYKFMVSKKILLEAFIKVNMEIVYQIYVEPLTTTANKKIIPVNKCHEKIYEILINMLDKIKNEKDLLELLIIIINFTKKIKFKTEFFRKVCEVVIVKKDNTWTKIEFAPFLLEKFVYKELTSIACFQIFAKNIYEISDFTAVKNEIQKQELYIFPILMYITYQNEIQEAVSEFQEAVADSSMRRLVSRYNDLIRSCQPLNSQNIENQKILRHFLLKYFMLHPLLLISAKSPV